MAFNEANKTFFLEGEGPTLKNRSSLSTEIQSFELTVNRINFNLKFSSNCHLKANHQSHINK